MKAKRLVLLAAAVAVSAPVIAFAQSKAPAKSPQVKRGEYLVNAIGCHDCHTPMKMGPNGPEPDMARMLSGHPQDMQVPPAPPSSGPWVVHTAPLTAWSGPWGLSFAVNLTPDPDTGVLQNFTEQQFVQAIRTGKHQGQGRPILPPMPWPAYKNLSDQDLKAVFAYLRQIPAIKNKVPDPVIATH